ncbi:MAG TPA: hypothetical protein VIA10_16205 [Gaiellaceae bacterium]|jgi:hypothetical protein
MRPLLALAAALLAGGCTGGDDSATETVTVSAPTTVTVTTTPPPPTTRPPSGPPPPPLLPAPLPPSGTLPVDDFNEYTASHQLSWERDLAGTTDAFVGPRASEASSRSFQATSSGDSAGASLTLDGLMDDSVRAQRYELELGRRGDGTWKVEAASWSQRCQPNRGHQTFSPEPCV